MQISYGSIVITPATVEEAVDFLTRMAARQVGESLRGLSVVREAKAAVDAAVDFTREKKREAATRPTRPRRPRKPKVGLDSLNGCVAFAAEMTGSGKAVLGVLVDESEPVSRDNLAKRSKVIGNGLRQAILRINKVARRYGCPDLVQSGKGGYAINSKIALPSLKEAL